MISDIKSLLLMMFIINLNFMMLSHPLSLTLLIIIQTINICLLFNLLSMSSWFSYILFLTFLGGMLVLFIYMTTLASNEMFKFSTQLPIIILLSLPVSLTIMFQTPSLLPSTTKFNINSLTWESSNNFLQMFNFPNLYITMFIISYLLITLIIVVYICKLNQGSLRQLTYE